MSATTPSFEPIKSSPAHKPGWERSDDDVGKRFWQRPTREQRARVRRVGYVGSIVVNAILLYVVHHLLAWKAPFITPSFADVLWAIDLSLWATILANALFLGYEAAWFRRGIQIILTGIAFLVAALLYAVFPFDLGDSAWNDGARLALVVVMVALIIAIVVQAIVFVVDVARRAFLVD
jgi:hypothetical protein